MPRRQVSPRKERSRRPKTRRPVSPEKPRRPVSPARPRRKVSPERRRERSPPAVPTSVAVAPPRDNPREEEREVPPVSRRPVTPSRKERPRRTVKLAARRSVTPEPQRERSPQKEGRSRRPVSPRERPSRREEARRETRSGRAAVSPVKAPRSPVQAPVDPSRQPRDVEAAASALSSLRCPRPTVTPHRRKWRPIAEGSTRSPARDGPPLHRSPVMKVSCHGKPVGTAEK